MHINAFNIPKAFEDLCWKMKTFGVEGSSRNGRVVTIEDPVTVSVLEPTQRVITCPIRDANPFFHAMEFVWMMAGRQDAKWISQFNKRMWEYAEVSGDIHGAYGHRWLNHFQVDQIDDVIQMLKKDPTTRQAVIAMWDPKVDLSPWDLKDRPCNTHIYFRVISDYLDMTVCNRSNDLVWGMMGANAVHMTLLHELIARAAGIHVGKYNVFTNNLHIYEDVPNFNQYLGGYYVSADVYRDGICTYPVLWADEDYHRFLFECSRFCAMDFEEMVDYHFHSRWLECVAKPLYLSWFLRRWERPFLPTLEACEADDFRIAATEWCERRAG